MHFNFDGHPILGIDCYFLDVFSQRKFFTQSVNLVLLRFDGPHFFAKRRVVAGSLEDTYPKVNPCKASLPQKVAPNLHLCCWNCHLFQKEPPTSIIGAKTGGQGSNNLPGLEENSAKL